MSTAEFASFLFSDWSWVFIAVGAVVLPTAVSAAFLRLRRIRGPVLTGAAQVLSLRQFGSSNVNGSLNMLCRVRLRVDLGDRDPYDVTVWKNIAPWDVAALGRGTTITVQVSAKNPKKVSIGGGRAARQRVTPTRAVVDAPRTVNVNYSSTTQSADAPSLASNPPDTAAMFTSVGAPVDPVELQNLLAGKVSSPPVVSAADILATGQHVSAVLKSFSPTGTTPRSLGRTPSRSEVTDAPHYLIAVEFHFPHLAPMTGRAIQVVPPELVPKLAIGLELPCVVDAADPSHLFVVDWQRV